LIFLWVYFFFVRSFVFFHFLVSGNFPFVGCFFCEAFASPRLFFQSPLSTFECFSFLGPHDPPVQLAFDWFMWLVDKLVSPGFFVVVWCCVGLMSGIGWLV